MMIRKMTLAIAIAALAAPVAAQDMTPFGTDEDTAYADVIWKAMTDMRMAGSGQIHTFPYPGVEPHGMMLETFYTTATIGDHTGALVIKRNYGPENVSEDEVINDPDGHLNAITIMFQREADYDPETGNWFYAKYLPDGSLDMNPAGVALAGLVGKGGDEGCIACHQNAGDNYLFTTTADLTVN